MLKHFLKLGLNANWRNWALETLWGYQAFLSKSRLRIQRQPLNS
jgi:hypothetical protein